MVLQSLADAGESVPHLDAERAQQIRGAYARQLQQLRRVVGAARQDHFLVGAHLHRRAALAALDVTDADGALAVEDDAGRMRSGADVDIRPLHRRIEKGGRRTDAQAVLDRALRVGDAFLDRAVVIVVAGNPERDRAGHEGLAERILPVHGGNGEVAVAAAIFVLALADPLLHPLEIRQHIRIAPAAVAELRPGIEILALAAVVDVTVDRGGAAERLATRRVDAAAAGPGPRLLLVGPVDAFHVEGFDEARRQMDVGMPIPGSCFEHADADGRIFAQPVGEHASGGARADDHIIECIGHFGLRALTAASRSVDSSNASSPSAIRLR